MPFVNYFDNYIYLNPTSSYYESLQIYEYTQSRVFRYGGEASIGTKPLQQLAFTSSVEYVYSEQLNGAKKGFTLPFSPPLSFLFTTNYTINPFWKFQNINIATDYRITSKQDKIVPPEEKTPGYNVCNLSLMTDMQLLKNVKAITVRLKLNNVFNTRYFDHTSYYRIIQVPQPGRNASLSVTIPF